MGAAIATPKGKSLPSPPPKFNSEDLKKEVMFLASCRDCKKEHNASESVPYIVHEASMARMERQAKRLWITVLALIVFLVATNGAWIWYESHFSDIVTTIEAEQDGSGVNIVSGGDLDYGAEGESNNP